MKHLLMRRVMLVMRYRFSFICICLLSAVLAWPALPSTLTSLKPDHPRILVHESDFKRIAQLINHDELAKRWYLAMKQRGEEMLDEPVTRYHLRDGRRLLYESREVLARVMVLALLHRLEPDPRYIERIWADLESAANFKHWNPNHFLDVAEMAAAFGIAYDWLYDHWSQAQRTTIRQAILEHGLKPGLRAYETDAWWTRTKINWNQVCNGGLIMTALAIADEEPALSARFIDQAVASLPISMQRYAPDGGYDEGPGYWSYGTGYNVLAIAALQSALGHDFGLSKAPGFDVTAGFPVQLTGPTGMAFNFGDGKARTPRSPAMFYLARQFDQPSVARFAALHNAGGVLDLLWYDPALLAKSTQPMPLNAVYHSADVGVLRSSWDDPDAWYVGVKGGAIDHGHAQLDLGSFILESQGIRWLIDLGADDYNLPGYFDSSRMRWLYYRNRAEGHNTLVINPGASLADQRRDAKVPVTLKGQTLTADLTPAYPGQIKRTLTLDTTNDCVRVVDQFAFDEPSELWWFAHTKAEILLRDDARAARLVQDGKQLKVRIISPGGATFRVMDASPLASSPNPEGQNPNNGAVIANASPNANFVIRGEMPRFGEPDPSEAVRKLAICLEGVTSGRIEVEFENVDIE